MSRKEMMRTELGRFLFGALDDSYELMYSDRRDELPTDLYRRALREGASARETVLQEFIDETMEPQRWESAYEFVIAAALSRSINLTSPIVSVDPDDWYLLIEEVLDRDTSDGWNVVMSIAARDTVVLGVRLSEGYVSRGNGNVDDLGQTFGLLTEEQARESEWLNEIVRNGCGHPTALVAVPGDELFGFLRDLYASPTGKEKYVTIRTFDVGLFDAYNGDGWFEQVDGYGGQEFELDVDEFLSRSWIDNEPGNAGTWTQTIGDRARLKALGDVTLRVLG